MGGSGPLDAGRHVPLPAAPIVRARGVQKADGQSLDVPAVRQDAQTAWPGVLRSARGHKGAGSCRERALAHRSGSSWDRLLPRCRSGARRRSAVLGYSARRGGESWTAALRWTGRVTAGGFRQAARFLYQRPRRHELPDSILHSCQPLSPLLDQGSVVGIWQDRTTAVATLSFAGRDRRSVVAKWR